MTQSNRADMQDIKPDTTDNEKNFQLDWSAWLMFVAILSSIFLAAMDQTVVSTALPTIARDLNGLAKLPWIVTAYLLTSTVCLPVYGKLGDLLGRKYLLQSAVLLFLAGSALSGLAQNIDELILFRALQGIGGGGSKKPLSGASRCCFWFSYFNWPFSGWVYCGDVELALDFLY